jgi:hypothetical protein
MNASLQIAGPNLVVLTTEGELLVLRKNPEKYEEVRRYTIGEGQTWGQPVLFKSGVVVRTGDSIGLWSF